MKLFQRLLVAPAALGLLSPLAANATEVNLNDISNYSDVESIELANAFDNEELTESPLLAGGEGLVDGPVGGFSETTTASFSTDFAIGSVDGLGATTALPDGNQTMQAVYGFQIDLNTSFTGEDSLDITIDIGDGASGALAFEDTTDVLTLDGLTYTFPVGGATVMVGDNTDISAVYTGACAYSSFTDYMGNCGTGNSVGVGGNGATAAMSYAFDSGFSLAGGVSSTPTSILTEEGSDTFGIEAAYSADSYGVAVAYSDAETTTYWGVNGMYAFDFATLSAGVESEDPDSGSTKTGFFVGLSFPEVGAGTFDIGLATSANYASSDTEYYTYEASYSYPINDGMTITPGVYIKEGTTDTTGFAVKTSFSF